MTREELAKLYKAYDLTLEDTHTMQRGQRNIYMVTRSGIEKIQAAENITVTFEVVSSVHDFAAVKAIAERDGKRIETYGSAKKGAGKEGNTATWYVLEVAEKRALARAILKFIGWYALGIKGEEEAWNEQD